MRKFFLILCLIILTFSACQKNIGEEITYNAAYVINGEDHSISVINLETNEVTNTFILRNFDYPHHIYLSPDKFRLAISAPSLDLSGGHVHSATPDGKAKLVTLNALNLEKLECDKNKQASHNLIFSPDGSELWTAYMGTATVQIYDAEKMKEKTTVTVGTMPLEVTFSANGQYAFVCNSGDNTVTVIDVATKAVAATIAVGNTPVGAWMGSNNKMYVDNEESNSISVINVATLTVEETITLGYKPAMVAYNGTANELYITDPDAGKLHYYTFTTQWTLAGSISTGANAHAVAISDDKTKAYVTNQNANTVTVIDLTSKTVITNIAVGKKPNGIVLRFL